MVQPSSRREGFSAIPNVKWEDVGGLDVLRKEFDRYIVRRIKYPEDYEVIINTRDFNCESCGKGKRIDHCSLYIASPPGWGVECISFMIINVLKS